MKRRRPHTVFLFFCFVLGSGCAYGDNTSLLPQKTQSIEIQSVDPYSGSLISDVVGVTQIDDTSSLVIVKGQSSCLFAVLKSEASGLHLLKTIRKDEVVVQEGWDFEEDAFVNAYVAGENLSGCFRVKKGDCKAILFLNIELSQQYIRLKEARLEFLNYETLFCREKPSLKKLVSRPAILAMYPFTADEHMILGVCHVSTPKIWSLYSGEFLNELRVFQILGAEHSGYAVELLGRNGANVKNVRCEYSTAGIAFVTWRQEGAQPSFTTTSKTQAYIQWIAGGRLSKPIELLPDGSISPAALKLATSRLATNNRRCIVTFGNAQSAGVCYEIDVADGEYSRKSLRPFTVRCDEIWSLDRLSGDPEVFPVGATMIGVGASTCMGLQFAVLADAGSKRLVKKYPPIPGVTEWRTFADGKRVDVIYQQPGQDGNVAKLAHTVFTVPND